MHIKPDFSITISAPQPNPPPQTTNRHYSLLLSGLRQRVFRREDDLHNYIPRPKFILTHNPLQASINIDKKYLVIQSFAQPQNYIKYIFRTNTVHASYHIFLPQPKQKE